MSNYELTFDRILASMEPEVRAVVDDLTGQVTTLHDGVGPVRTLHVCERGHVFNRWTCYIYRGKRYCRVCRRDYQSRRRWAKGEGRSRAQVADHIVAI
jgi:hypothetical protein